MGPSKDGYKLSIQIACLRLAVTLKAIRFLTHLVKEIEYVWITHDLDMSQNSRLGAGCALPRQDPRDLDIRRGCAEPGREGLPHQLRSGKTTSLSQRCEPTRCKIHWRTNVVKW